MFGTIRRHQQWLWIVIITLTIISFLAFFNPAKTQSVAEFRYGSVNGRALSREEVMDARKEEYLSYRFSQGSWPNAERGANLDLQIRQRLFWIEKLKELNIRVGDESVAHYMAMFFRSKETGAFNQKLYETVVKILPEAGLTEDDMMRYFRHQVGLNQLVAALGTSGRLVPPRVIDARFQLENEQIAGNMAFLALSNYTDKVTIDTNQFMAFYTNRAKAYSTPPKVQVTYVEFLATNYFADADKRLAEMSTNVVTAIDTEYQKRGTNYFKDMTEAQAKESLKAEFRHEIALGFARSNSVQFANSVISVFNTNSTAGALAAVAQQKGVALKETKPFTQSDGPTEIADNYNFSYSAFQLTAEQPLAPQVQTTNGYFVLALKGTIPSQPPVFEEVRSKVLDDYKRAQAQELLSQAGTALKNALTEGLAKGKTFKAICDEAKVTAVEVPLFSSSTLELADVQERLPMQQFKQIALGVPTGKLSSYTPVRDGGFIFYARERRPVDEAVKALKQGEFAIEMRDGWQGNAFEQWFRGEFEKSGLAPLEQPAMAGKAR